MRINQLYVRNFCQHAERQVSFSSGMTAIVGPNGSGKSNLLGAVRLALLGSSGNQGILSDDVAVTASGDAPADVSIEVEHNGVTATIVRRLRPTMPTTLRFADGREVSGERKVREELYGWLGVAPEVLEHVVLVRQEALFGFIDQSASERSVHLQRLFGLDVAERLYQFLGKSLSQLPQVSLQPLDPLRAAVRQAAQRLETAEQQLASAGSLDKIQAARSEAQQRIADVTTVAARRREAARLQAAIASAVKTAESARRSLGVLNARDNTAREAASNLEADAAQARLSQANHAENTRRDNAILGAKQAQTQLQAQLAGTVMPTPPANCLSPSQCEEYQAAASRLDEQVRVAEQLLRSWQCQGGTCPTCGTLLTPDVAKATEQQQLIARCGEESRRLRHTVAETQQYRQAEAAATARRVHVESSLQAVTSQLEALSSVALPVSGDPEAWQAVLAAYAAAKQTISEVAGLHRDAMTAVTAAETETARLSGMLAALPPDDGAPLPDATAWGQRLTELAAAQEQYLRYRDAVAAETAALAGARKALETAEEQYRQLSVDNAWRGRVTRWRELLHKENIPRLVIHSNLRRMQDVMNDLLTLVSADFRVRATDALSFEASFASGVRQPAERLSGGQKVILALVFRLSLVLLRAGNINAIYLDEPTAYLDERHIRGLEPVLSRFRTYASSRGLQCVMVTHEQSLAPLFDSVISL